MDISKLTIGEAREIASLLNIGTKNVESKESHPYTIGEAYFIRTVTHHYTGRLKSVYANELVLTECAWIADDGRFSDALNTGNVNEVEPYPEGSEVVIGRQSIIDATIWKSQLPLSQK